MFGAQSLYADVVQHHHANLDSFPFRYGIHFSKTTSLKIFNCRNYKWQVNGEKFEVLADFVGKNEKIESGLFILAITDFPNPRVVTVMRNDVEAEFFLSKLLRSLRESGEVTTDNFLEWHPLYLSGEANTFEKLAKLYAAQTPSSEQENASSLVAKAKAEAANEYQKLLKEKEEEIQRLKKEKENAEIKAKEEAKNRQIAEEESSKKDNLIKGAEKENQRIRSIAEEAIEGLNERDEVITSQQIEIDKKNEKLKAFEEQLIHLAKQHPQYDGSEVGISTVARLVSVEKKQRTKANGQTVNCVFLHFADGLPERKMDEVFDPQDIIYTKAKNLVGENVATITWKPEIFRATHWFRDIFLWDGEAPVQNPPLQTSLGKKDDVGIYLNCPFSEKDECKALGGKWDPSVKKWYVPKGINHGLFAKWLPNDGIASGLDTEDGIPF